MEARTDKCIQEDAIQSSLGHISVDFPCGNSMTGVDVVMSKVKLQSEIDWGRNLVSLVFR